jgi:gliding motility-associated-like protein
LRTITYNLTVTDAIGCVSQVTDSVTVDVTPPIKVKTFPFDTIGYSGDRFQLLASSPLPNPNYSFSWTPSFGLSDPTIFNPFITIGSIGDDVTYQVIFSTPAGCKGEGYVRVRVYKGPDIYVPTAFSPNGDGKNDKLTPFPVGIKKLNYFRIFNRWGQLTYSTTTLHEGWDGKIGGKEQGSGVFVWMVEGITKDDKMIKKQGTVLLIR